MTSGDEAVAGRILAGYRPGDHDELVGRDGRPHEATVPLASTMDVLGLKGLLRRSADIEQVVEDDGVTYAGQATWHLDPLPMVLDQGAWGDLAAGLVQRAELLDAVLADLYGPRNLLRRGTLPAELVLSHPEFIRAADRIRLPSTRQLFMSATDLARGSDGRWVALSDRTQAPSGAGYAMENRRVVSRVMPGLYRGSQPERLRRFFHTMRSALLEVAPRTADAPRVVLLTPGPESETAFDQAYLSTILGYPLVTSEDLTVRGGKLYLRALSGLEQVDVLLRRVDTMWADPLEGHSHSMLGVAGLMEAARLGNVSVVNPLGSGVLENNGMLAHLDALCQALLGEDLLLPSPQTFWCGDAAARGHVLANLDTMVIKPIARGDEPFTTIGRELSAAEREEITRRITAEPTRWVGQVEVQPSTAPVVTTDGLAPRDTVLRTFAVAAGGRYELMAGGLARLAPHPTVSRVASGLGALSKDVWVLPSTTVNAAVEPEADPAPELQESVTVPARVSSEPALASRAAEGLFWLGRYSERAEDTVRLLRVADDLVEDHLHRRGTSGHVGTQAVLRAVTSVTMAWPGFLGEDAASQLDHPGAELLSLVMDSDREGSVAHAVRRTTALAQSLREQLSMDTWVVLGSLERQLADLGELAQEDAAAVGMPLQPTLTRVLEGLLALAGLQAESLVRDAGWNFLDCGRRLERALQLLTLLRFTMAEQRRPAVESFVQEAVLVTAESVITHRRRFGGKLGSKDSLAGLLELLLLDEGNPRSVAYQLVRLHEDVTRIPSSGPGAEELAASVQRALATLREMSLGREGLAEALDGLRDDLSATASQFERLYFIHRAPPREMERQQAREGVRP